VGRREIKEKGGGERDADSLSNLQKNTLGSRGREKGGGESEKSLVALSTPDERGGKREKNEGGEGMNYCSSLTVIL